MLINRNVTNTSNVRIALVFKSKTLTHSSNAMITYDKISSKTSCRTTIPMVYAMLEENPSMKTSHNVAKKANKPMVTWAFVISLIEAVSTCFLYKDYSNKTYLDCNFHRVYHPF